MRRRLPVFFPILLLASCRPAHPARAAASRDGISVAAGYLTAAPGGEGGTVYFVVRNGGSAPDTLRAVEVGGVRATLHTVVPSGGMMRMAPLAAPAIPPGDSLVLRSGGPHAMFDGLTAPIAVGDTVAVRLVLAHGGTIALWFPVEPYGGW